MIFITSDIKVLATIFYKDGRSETLYFQFRTAKRGLFKEEMERQILKSNKLIIKVRVH